MRQIVATQRAAETGSTETGSTETDASTISDALVPLGQRLLPTLGHLVKPAGVQRPLLPLRLELSMIMKLYEYLYPTVRQNRTVTIPNPQRFAEAMALRVNTGEQLPPTATVSLYMLSLRSQPESSEPATCDNQVIGSVYDQA